MGYLDKLCEEVKPLKSNEREGRPTGKHPQGIIRGVADRFEKTETTEGKPSRKPSDHPRDKRLTRRTEVGGCGAKLKGRLKKKVRFVRNEEPHLARSDTQAA